MHFSNAVAEQRIKHLRQVRAINNLGRYQQISEGSLTGNPFLTLKESVVPNTGFIPVSSSFEMVFFLGDTAPSHAFELYLGYETEFGETVHAEEPFSIVIN